MCGGLALPLSGHHVASPHPRRVGQPTNASGLLVMWVAKAAEQVKISRCQSHGEMSTSSTERVKGGGQTP